MKATVILDFMFVRSSTVLYVLKCNYLQSLIFLVKGSLLQILEIMIFKVTAAQNLVYQK